MASPTQELKAAELMHCIGRPLSHQHVFAAQEIVPASPEEIKRFFPLKINKSLRRPSRFTFQGIPVEELHFLLNDKNEVVSLYLQLDNQDLVGKLTRLAGQEYIASGSSLDEEIPFAFYSWKYKEGCINLELNALKLRFKPKIVQDYGWVIFFNCDPLSNITVPAH